MNHERGRIGEAMARLERPVGAEMCRLLAIPAGADGTSVSFEREDLSRTRVVYRVRASVNGKQRSLVIKRLDPTAALRTRRVTNRWLPAIGLDRVAPRLMGTAASDDGEFVWHIYEDLSGVTLKLRQSDRECVRAAVQLIADLHIRGVNHPFAAECRRDGADLGMHFFITNVRAAANLLEALRPPAVPLSHQQAAVRDRLRHRLDELLGDAPRRAQLVAEAGGPDTMLHGDLWTTNVIVADAEESVRVRLVDWDNAGIGPICYDLSTFLFRFERAVRPWVRDRYRDAIARAGWCLPSTQELNLLCDTAECARYASRIIWPARALLHEGAAWGFAELNEIDEWFEALRPVVDE